MSENRITLTFSRDEAQGLAELLAKQHNDRGFLELSEEIECAIAISAEETGHE